MNFQIPKMSLTGSLMMTLICIAVSAESSLHKQNEDQSIVKGCQGLPGRDGRDGRDGIQGPYGPPGICSLSAELERKLENMLTSFTERYTGIAELSEHRTESRQMPGKMSSRLLEQSSIGGATYIHWGRKACPPKTLKLYSGFVAGSLFTHTGSGANHLCLPDNPQWNKTVPGHTNKAFLYGTEFQLEANPGFHRNNAGGKSQHEHDVQCAVCQALDRMNQLMIPARLECPLGWNLEYLGFLMSGHHTHQRSEYVCVDQDPDVHPATSANLNGNLFYPVEVVCGALPCPPYVDGYEVTCVVCTR